MAGQEQKCVAEIERNRREGNRRARELRYSPKTGTIAEFYDDEPIGDSVPTGKEDLGFSAGSWATGGKS
jgi:hypothetical protein